MAATRSFKQMCPSCEAMVPIRDHGLIGRKIDCPKCKYRFVVEEPEPEEDEAPAKAEKTKPTGATKGKPGPRGKGAGKGKDSPDRPAKKGKEKKGSPLLLILGIGVAVVALLALVVGGLAFMGVFGGDDSTGDGGGGISPGPVAGTPGGANPDKGKPGGQPGRGGKPSPGQGVKGPDITNFLPNDTQAVASIPMARVRGSALRQVALGLPGGFKEEDFRQAFGFEFDKVHRVVTTSNLDKDWIFTVVRTSQDLNEKDLASHLRAEVQPPIQGKTYYDIKGDMDSMGNLLFKAAQPRKSFTFHLLTPNTVVFADTGVMREFLEGGAKPKFLSEAPKGPSAPGRPGGSPMPGGYPGGSPMPGGGPGGAGTGASAPPPPPPGGPMGADPGMGEMGPGGAAAPPPPSPPSGPGGYSGGSVGGPPGGYSGGSVGMPPGGYSGGGSPMPGGFPGGAGRPEPPAQVNSYMTIAPALKAVLDKIEKRDNKGQPNVLLAAAVRMDAKVVSDPLKAFYKQIPDPVVSKEAYEKNIENTKVVGIALTDFSEDKVGGALGFQLANERVAVAEEKELNKKLALAPPVIKLALGLDIGIKQGGGAGRPGFPGQPGYPGGGYPGGGYPGGGYPMPGGFDPGMDPGMGEGGGAAPPPPVAGPGGSAGGPPGGYPGGSAGGPPGGYPGGSAGGPPGGYPGGSAGGPPGGYPGGSAGGYPGGGYPGGGYPGGGYPGGYPGRPGTPGTGGTPAEKDGYITASRDGAIIVVSAEVSWKRPHYEVGVNLAARGMLFLKGQADLAGSRWRIFDLASATQRYLADKGAFPQGVLPRSPSSERVLDWRPDQRLSWMVDLLPYVDGGNFRDLDIDRDLSWREGKNVLAGQVVVPSFLGHGRTGMADRYVNYPEAPGKMVQGAATHFVGVAGVGLDAAYYTKGDANTAGKLGVFGYDRVTKKEEIKDGLDKTILLLQIPPDYSTPWTAGGGGTVRGVSEDFDAVEPFVCTEYQGKRGTFAVMADGKVRFIPADIDPKDFRAMCTIAGGEQLGLLDKIAPEVPNPNPAPVTKPGLPGGPDGTVPPPVNGGIVPPPVNGGIVPPPRNGGIVPLPRNGGIVPPKPPTGGIVPPKPGPKPAPSGGSTGASR
jgi:hypothetical protein